MKNPFPRPRILPYVVSLAAVVAAMILLQRVGEGILPEPLGRVERLHLRWEPAGDTEVVVAQPAAAALLAGAELVPELGACPCGAGRGVLLTGRDLLAAGRACDHCLNVETARGTLYFRMPPGFQAGLAALADSLRTPVPGATEREYAGPYADREPRVWRLAADMIRAWGAPRRIASADGDRFLLSFRDPRGGTLGAPELMIDLSTGAARSRPRL